MPKYIIVTGVSNSGKTTSIRTLWESLGGKKLPNPPFDFHDTLTYENKKIGFHSCGDSIYYLEKYKKGIPDLLDCDIIISACKSSGNTQTYFVDLCNISDLYWVGKAKQNDPIQSSQQTVSHIKLIIHSL
jgi:hypothetical protein